MIELKNVIIMKTECNTPLRKILETKKVNRLKYQKSYGVEYVWNYKTKDLFFGKRAVVHLASTQLRVLMGSIPKTTYVYVPKDILEPIVTEWQVHVYSYLYTICRITFASFFIIAPLSLVVRGQM